VSGMPRDSECSPDSGLRRANSAASRGCFLRDDRGVIMTHNSDYGTR
jgi:hypothetical protein